MPHSNRTSILFAIFALMAVGLFTMTAGPGPSSAAPETTLAKAKKKCKAKKSASATKKKKKCKKKPVTAPVVAPVVASPALLSIAPPNHDYGIVPFPGPGADYAFTVTNTGGTASGPVTATIAQGNDAPYTVKSNGCSGGLVSGGNCAVTINFQPSSGGLFTGTLTVSASPGGSANATLIGTGI